MNDAKNLLNKLKETRDYKKDELAGMTEYDLSSDEAQTINNEIEDLDEIIKYYELLIEKLEKIKTDDPIKQEQINRQFELITNKLKSINDNSNYDITTLRSNDNQELERNIDSIIDNPEDTNSDTIQVEQTNANSEENNQPSEETSSEQVEREEDNPVVETTDSESTSEENEEEEERKPISSSEQAYVSIIDDRIRNVEKNIERLKKIEKYDLTGKTSARRIGYELELMELKEDKKNFDNRESLSAETEERISQIDQDHAELLERREEYKAQIEHLKEMKENLKGLRNKVKVQRDIKRLEIRLNQLRAGEIQMIEGQKSLMYPKYKADIHRQAQISKAEGKVDYIEEKIAVNDEMQQMLDDRYLGDRIQGVVTGIRGEFYQGQLDRASEVLEQMQQPDANVELLGQRRTTISQLYERMIRDRNENQNQETHELAA